MPFLLEPLTEPPADVTERLSDALEAGAVGEAVGHDDVLVEVVRAGGAVTFHLVNHLTDGKDGGRGGGGVGLHLRGGRG